MFPEGARTLDGNLQPAQPWSWPGDRENAGAGCADAHLRRARSLATWEQENPLSSHYHRGWASDFFTEADIAERGKDVYQRLSEQVMNEIAKLTIDGNG